MTGWLLDGHWGVVYFLVWLVFAAIASKADGPEWASWGFVAMLVLAVLVAVVYGIRVYGLRWVKDYCDALFPKTTVLKVVCAWCGKDMGEKDGQGTEGEAGTFCEDCWEKKFPGVPYPKEN